MLLKVEEQNWTFHLTQIAHRLKEQGIGLKVLDQAIDTTTVTGKLLFDMLAAISEFETSIRTHRCHVRSWGESGHRFRAAPCLFIANS